MNVHPAAAIWPMLPDDELAALAASIGEVGLLEPIVLTPAGELLDGRNRLAACELAGAEPTFATYAGDPVTYVLARNDTRRHLTKGQRAMAAWLTAATNVQSLNGRAVAEAAGVAHGMVGMAAVVAEVTPLAVANVLDGTLALKAAYDEALKARAVAASFDDRFAMLPADLADLVREERMSLAEAEAAATERDRRTTEERRDARALLTRILDLVAPEQPSLDFVDNWARRLGQTEPALVDRIDAAIDTLTDLRKLVSST